VSRPTTYSFRRYLAAKESVDDRALHRPTLQRVAADLERRAAQQSRPVRILEVGTGLGSMLRRVAEWGHLPGAVDYRGVDQQADLVAAARTRTLQWASDAGYTVTGDATPDDPARMQRSSDATGTESGPDGRDAAAPDRLTVTFEADDAFDVADTATEGYDLVVAAAFLDVVDPHAALESFASLGPAGAGSVGVYAPITFDGVTAFAPGADPGLSDAIVRAYHETMVGPDRGGPQTGRELFDHVRAAGGTVAAAGGGDWVVTPPYADDEAYFLHYLLDTLESAVGDRLDTGASTSPESETADRAAPAPTRGDDGPPLTADRLAAWVERRHDEVTAESLTFLAHNMDVYAQFGE
jgi:hypothetical protein